MLRSLSTTQITLIMDNSVVDRENALTRMDGSADFVEVYV